MIGHLKYKPSFFGGNSPASLHFQYKIQEKVDIYILQCAVRLVKLDLPARGDAAPPVGNGGPLICR